MFLELTFDAALELLNKTELVFDETIVPKTCPRASHCPYLPEYDWLFLFERKLARFLDPWMKEHRPELIGSSGIVSEALSNAYCHGHKRDPSLPISVKVYQGEHGVMVQITDTGKGFNIDTMVSNFLVKKNYFHNAGNGIKRMFSSKVFGLFYAGRGTSFHLVYMFDEKLMDNHEITQP
ncbi:MAG: ATP-binding protein [Desulfuromonadales bacterium]|nr:ATP-binding protein [Desulfuromonadales bacterium]